VVDSDWIAELGKNPAYQHINLTVEIGKMEAWLGLPKNAKRIKTRSFVLNWLNKIEAPMWETTSSPSPTEERPDRARTMGPNLRRPERSWIHLTG
jgi:hypothetical protein